MGLPCVNCGKAVDPNEAKFFAQVFVCPTCYAIAERLFERGEQELRMMLVMLKECIRVAIVKKELQFPEQNLEDMPRKDLFVELARLTQEARQEALKNEPPQSEHARWKATTPTTTPSLESTKLLAAGKAVDGSPSSGSTSE